MTLTRGVAAFALETQIANIPKPVLDLSKEMMLNAVGVGLAGGRDPAARMVVEYVRGLGGAPVCSVLGEGFSSPPEFAALANGSLSHVLDFDETIERRGNHPSPAMFASVMALAEQASMRGRAALEAFVIGCEVSTKIGAVGDLDELKSNIFKNGWHLSGVAGTIGATAAAGRLLALDQEQMENALGIAVSQASGVQANYGHSTKCLHAGQAAMHGIMAARLASQGFTGARNGLEAADGFLGCFRGNTHVDQDQFVASLGAPFDVIDPGLAIKFYPCATTTHTSIYAVQQLVQEFGLSPDQVQSIEVSLPALGGHTNERNTFPRPESGLQAKFSVPYCVAVALVHGTPRMHHFTDAAVKDPKISLVLDKVSLHWDEQATRDSHLPSTVRMTLVDGRQIKQRTAVGKGHASNPMTRQELDEKFIDCSEGRIPREIIDRALIDFRRIEEIPDVGPLVAALGARNG